MSTITYRIGNAIEAFDNDEQKHRSRILAHICNNCGQWGAGFVVPLGIHHPSTRSLYLAAAEAGLLKLGELQLDPVLLPHGERNRKYVANLIAQDNKRKEPPYVDYVALRRSLLRLSGAAEALTADIYMPRIGCGIGGGEWRVVEKIIEETLTDYGIPVVVFDLMPTDKKSTKT